MNKKIFYIFLFFTTVILAGYLRETFFVRVKWCEAVLDGASRPGSFWLYSFLDTLNYDALQVTKYIATCIFIALFFCLSVLMVKLFFTNAYNYKIVQTVFATVFACGILAYALGYIIPYREECYELSRWIIGVIETPLIIAILFPLFWVLKKAGSQ